MVIGRSRFSTAQCWRKRAWRAASVMTWPEPRARPAARQCREMETGSAAWQEPGRSDQAGFSARKCRKTPAWSRHPRWLGWAWQYSSEGRGSSIRESLNPAPMIVLTYSESVRSKRGEANVGVSAGASVKRQCSTQPAGFQYSLTIHFTFTPRSSRIHDDPL